MNKNNKIQVISTLISTFLFVAASACCGATNQVPIGISDVLHHVEQATCPNQSYTATVHQIVTRKSSVGLTTAMLALAPASVTNEEDFEVTCTPSGIVRPTKGISTQPQSNASAMSSSTQSSGVGAGGGGGGGGLGGTPIASPQTINSPTNVKTNEVRLEMTINPINTLRHIEQTHSGTITDDIYKGVSCYNISSTHGRFSFDLWIDKTNWTVCREAISMSTNFVLDTQLEYEKWNGVLVPSRVVISRPDNATSVEQDYSSFQQSANK